MWFTLVRIAINSRASSWTKMASNRCPSWCRIVQSIRIKVLGVTLENKLKFKEHISGMYLKHQDKATKQGIKKSFQYLGESCGILEYKASIPSNSNYCPLSWMFCGKLTLNKLKQLHERIIRFVFVTQSLHMKPCLNREISVRYHCIEYGARPLTSLDVFMAIVPPTCRIILGHPF